VSTATPSIEWLRWTRGRGFDPDSPPPSPDAQNGKRATEIAGWERSIERQHERIAHAATSRDRERAERRLERLEDQRDRLVQQQMDLDDLAIDWPYLCASCGSRIPREQADYGAGRCARCRRGDDRP
jgi:hypothetical protein